MTTTDRPPLEGLGRYRFGWADPDVAGSVARRGLSREVVEEISALKDEPTWMRKLRLKGLSLFEKKSMPNWGADLSGINFDNIKYFVRSTEKQAASWEELPSDIRNTYDRLGIPEAEKQRLVAGVAAQYECLTGETRVWTASRGPVPISDVRPGEQVFSYDEDSCRFLVRPVRAAAQTGVRPVLRVQVGQRALRATANHPVLALVDERRADRQRARYRTRWTPVAELRVGDLVAVPRDLPVPGTPPPPSPRAAGLAAVAPSPVGGRRPLGAPTVDAGPPEASEIRQVQVAVADRNPEARMQPGNPRPVDLSDRGNPGPAAGLRGRAHAHSDTSVRPATVRHRAPHLGFARISGIEPDGVEPVYDIEVDGPHNFVAEGLVVHNSEVVYHKIREDLEQQGVVFLDTDTGLKQHEGIFREYFGSIIPPGDNKFAALNTAVWSGGSFIWVPPGVRVDIPLQAYFRINTENMGQFERTLIIVEDGGYVHYVEGCTAPIYSSDSLHSAVVEIIVKPGARCRYTTIQNWSNNVYNLVTKRAAAYDNATMEWIDGNIGSKVTMKYPSVYLLGPGARGETLSLAFAGEGQHQDAGAKMVHCAPNTSSSIVSKSVARGGGRTSYRGLVQVQEEATGAKANVRCDALLVDTISRSDTYPYVDVREDDVSMGHEATVSRVSDDQLFYLMSRGLSEEEAMAMIVRGFVEPIARELPMEYALELNRLIELQMEGAVG